MCKTRYGFVIATGRYLAPSWSMYKPNVTPSGITVITLEHIVYACTILLRVTLPVLLRTYADLLHKKKTAFNS